MDALAPLSVFYTPWFFFVWGACWGSFLNVVMHRYPRGQSVVHPPSACPQCGSQIAAYDNIPVLSWLILRGRCRRCKTRISPSYAINEALFGLASAGAIWLHPRDWISGLSLSGVALAGPAAIYLLARHGRSPWYLNAVALGGGAFYLFQRFFG